MELAIIVLGFAAAAVLSAVVRSRRFVEWLSVGVTAMSLILSSAVAYRVGTSGTYAPFSFISIDSLGALIMMVVSIVAFASAAYAVPCLRKESAKKIIDHGKARQYYALSAVFLTSIFLTMSVNNPVTAWIFLEATTLSTVFLISFYNRGSTIEAAWKYMILNAIGLLLAFFGTLLYFTAAQGTSITGLISWDGLAAHVKLLNPELVKIAFIFVLIGYGTKIGLAPMHTWKPDTYSKAPAPLGALFSGALLPVAFLILLRFKSLTDAAVGPDFSRNLLIGFGLLSLVVGAFSLLAVAKNKKMLAYSTIEHTGIIALGLGFGGVGALASVLLIIYHSFIKSALFFLTGKMLLKYHSTYIKDVKGALSVMPSNSVMYMLAVLAAAGFPPFGIFLSEFFVLSAGIESYWLVAVIALVAVTVAFIGFFRHASSMVFGDRPDDETILRDKISPWLLAPPAAMIGLALMITFYTPPFVQTLIREATKLL